MQHIARAWGVAALTAYNSDCECPCILKPVSFHVAQHTWNVTYKYTHKYFQTHVCVHIHIPDPTVSYLATSTKTVKKLTAKQRILKKPEYMLQCVWAEALMISLGERLEEPRWSPNRCWPAGDPAHRRSETGKLRARGERPTECSGNTTEDRLL